MGGDECRWGVGGFEPVRLEAEDETRRYQNSHVVPSVFRIPLISIAFSSAPASPAPVGSGVVM